MNSRQLLREIKRTDKTLQAAERVIANYEIPEPYCYLMPAFGFILGYQIRAKVSTALILQILKAQLSANTLLETQRSTHS